jgi:hypothetical protein
LNNNTPVWFENLPCPNPDAWIDKKKAAAAFSASLRPISFGFVPSPMTYDTSGNILILLEFIDHGVIARLFALPIRRNAIVEKLERKDVIIMGDFIHPVH